MRWALRSLRTRFFLISWPLVVAAVLAVAWGFDRWTVVELERFETNGPAGERGVVRIERSPDGARVAVEEIAVRGDGGGPQAAAARARLEELERAGSPEKVGEQLRRRARRTLWTSALVASLAAAAAALLLAGPLVRQVARLDAAASALRGGALSTRVAEGGDDELGRLAGSFNAMAAELERAELHKRNLVCDVAHELRTPLTNVVGLLEAIEDGLRAPDAATLASLSEEVRLLTALVDELQELSLAESGQLRFDLAPLDAVAAAAAAVAAMQPAAGGVWLEGPGGGEAIHARADGLRLAQVLRNLLRNALTHTPPGGTVKLTVERRGERVALAVADTGRGIPAEHLPLVWERFHRVDPSRDRRSGGMGLGLALVRQLVAGMHGEVTVESRVGFGSTFTVLLPAAEPPRELELAPRSSSAA